MVARGEPEAGMPYFAPAEDIRDLVALAWALEEGSRRFYQEEARRLAADPGQSLFQELAQAEAGHKLQLAASCQRLTGRPADPDAWRRKFGEAAGGETMEGGVPVAAALRWAEGQELGAVLELAMGLEINSYDLYIRMSRRVAPEERPLFVDLAAEEQRHLERLGTVLDGIL